MKKALTIGELLITMAIIGTIATLVLPGFLKDYHKKLYVTRLKKTVEMLENAVNQACIDNNVSYFYQTPYAKDDTATLEAFINKYFKTSNEDNNFPFAQKYKELKTGKEYKFNLYGNHAYKKLASGEAISFYCASNEPDHCGFRVDINSTDGPNIGGRDLFHLNVQKYTNKITDYLDASYCGGYEKQEGENEVIYQLKHISSRSGAGCYARLLQDNWEMKY